MSIEHLNPNPFSPMSEEQGRVSTEFKPTTRDYFDAMVGAGKLYLVTPIEEKEIRKNLLEEQIQYGVIVRMAPKEDQEKVIKRIRLMESFSPTGEQVDAVGLFVVANVFKLADLRIALNPKVRDIFSGPKKEPPLNTLL